MVSPVELTKLGVIARFQKLGSLRYVLIAGLLSLVLGGIEIHRYNKYSFCMNEASNNTNPFTELDKIIAGSAESFFSQEPPKSLPGDNKNNQGSISSREAVTYEMRLSAAKMFLDSERARLKSGQEECLTHYRYDVFQWFSWLNPIGVANAQIRIGGYTESDIRGIVYLDFRVHGGIFFLVNWSTAALKKH
jgi:hypothetical protein